MCSHIAALLFKVEANTLLGIAPQTAMSSRKSDHVSDIAMCDNQTNHDNQI